jgi:hypothetical protein
MEKKINYRAQFTLSPKNTNPDAPFHLLRMISNWINSKNPVERTKPIIFNGIKSGNLDFLRDGFSVIVKSLESKVGLPQYYALRFTHPESDGHMTNWRLWTTDIAIEFIDTGDYLFSLTNSFSIKSGFIGKISDPEINSPNIIKQIVTDKNWSCLLDKSVLKLEPVEVNHDNVKSYVKSIFDPDRMAPMIFVSRYHDGSLLLDPGDLSRKVVGNANVYYESDFSISEYLQSDPKFDDYRCSHGAVRIYLPKANFNKSNDYRRHRFYTSRQLVEDDSTEISKIIAESLVRRSVFTQYPGIQTIEDVDRLVINEQLKRAIENRESSQIIEAYKQQVESLNAEVLKKENDLSQYCSLYDDKDAELDLLKKRLKDLETKQFELTNINKALEATVKEVPSVLPFQEVPTSLLELLKLLATHYPSKIVILNEAYLSAEQYDLKDIKKGWKALRSIAENLHNIMFYGQGDKRAQFNNETGFDLSMTESKMTKGDKKLADKRIRFYKGKRVEINAHVGYGNRAPNILRVHFCVSADDQKIVIGHCGGHLETFSTKSVS